MKKLIVILVLLMLVSCIRKPFKEEKYVVIKPNETAFVLPLEGANKTNQKKFSSVEYLESKKVAAKRILIPRREHKTGRWSSDVKYIDTIQVIKVDRTPITREWTSATGTGTSTYDQSITVESRDSIAFSLGITITAQVEESNTATFLYYHPGTSLANIIDTNVRGFAASVLSEEFSKYNLSVARTKKDSVRRVLNKKIKSHFKNKGISITTVGIVGGLVYSNPKIQENIDKAFNREMDKELAKSKKEAELIENSRKEALAKSAARIKMTEERNENQILINRARAKADAANKIAASMKAYTDQMRLEIEMIKAQADLERAKAKTVWSKNWKGQLPSSVTNIPMGTPLMLDTRRPSIK